MKMAFEVAAANGLPLWPIAAISVMDSEFAASTSRWFESGHVET
jgi:hypothetical protein